MMNIVSKHQKFVIAIFLIAALFMFCKGAGLGMSMSPHLMDMAMGGQEMACCSDGLNLSFQEALPIVNTTNNLIALFIVLAVLMIGQIGLLKNKIEYYYQKIRYKWGSERLFNCWQHCLSVGLIHPRIW